MQRWFVSALCVCVLLVGSLPAQAQRPRSVLDQQTGATLSLAAEPWLFARDQPHLAAHARDYVGLYAVDINTAGTHRTFLAVFFWSTIDRRKGFAGEAPRVELMVDDRRVILTPGNESARDLGISAWPLTPPGKGAVFQVYAVDATLLRQLAESRFTSVRLLDDIDGDDEPLLTWKEGRRALAEFAKAQLD